MESVEGSHNNFHNIAWRFTCNVSFYICESFSGSGAELFQGLSPIHNVLGFAGALEYMVAMKVLAYLLVALMTASALKDLPTTLIAEISNGKVFYLTGPGGEASVAGMESAQDLCSEYGAQLAYAHEVYEAGERGLSKCRCGYLDEHTVAYPTFKEDRKCGDHRLGVLMCPTSYYKWQKHGWDAYCFLLGPGQTRRQAPSGAIDIGPGWVFHHAAYEGAGTITNLHDAEIQCNMKGATVANIDQMHEANNRGLQNCACGWLKQRQLAYSQAQNTLSCLPHDCVEPQPAKETGVMACEKTDDKYGYDVYCYRPKDFNKKPPKPPGEPVPGGTIFPIEGRNGPNSIKCTEEAEELCDMLGATLATATEYYAAYSNGQLQDCHCAYLSNAVSYSITEKNQCETVVDDSRLGVFSCAENWQQLGQRGYKAYCFKGKLEERQPSDDAAVPIPGGYVFLHGNADDNHTIVNALEADKNCRGRGAVLATNKQLTSAKDRGLTQCVCGWLSDHSAAYPLAEKLAFCGNEEGIIPCPLEGKDTTWGAYCFQPVRLTCKKFDPRRLFAELFAGQTPTLIK